MSIFLSRGSLLRLIVLLSLAGAAGCSATKPVTADAQQRPTVARAEAPAVEDPTPVQPPQPQVEPPRPPSTTGELQALMQARKISEMRTVYNGSYGASLLFETETLTYYVALFQQKDFWRVVKTADSAQAEQWYRNFSAETASLAQDELRRVRLQAEYAHTEKQLGERAADLAMLQNDVREQQQQESQVAQRRQQMRDEAEQLAAQQRDARRQLQELQRQIRQLEAQQAELAKSRGAAARPLPPK